MQATPWIRMSSLYSWSVSQNPRDVRLTRQPDAVELLSKAGVYLIADTRLPATWPGERLIYVGLAGGRGTGSDFHQRIHKHGLKAMNATAETIEGSSITDTRRWKAYRDAHLQENTDLSTILDSWLVRLLVLPNETEGDRSTIVLTEQMIGLVFDRNRHARHDAPQLPRCNDQRLADRLIALLDLAPEEDPHVEDPGQAVVTQDAADEMQLALNQLDDMTFDDEFSANFSDDENLLTLYGQVLAQIDDVCASAEGQAAGLFIHYAQEGTKRDLRVAWQFERPRRNLLRITSSAGGFNVWTHARADQLQELDVRASPVNDPLKARARVGGVDGGPVSWVGIALRLALVNGYHDRGGTP